MSLLLDQMRLLIAATFDLCNLADIGNTFSVLLRNLFKDSIIRLLVELLVRVAAIMVRK